MMMLQLQMHCSAEWDSVRVSLKDMVRPVSDYCGVLHSEILQSISWVSGTPKEIQI
jgi:hypothetical protein